MLIPENFSDSNDLLGVPKSRVPKDFLEKGLSAASKSRVPGGSNPVSFVMLPNTTSGINTEAVDIKVANAATSVQSTKRLIADKVDEIIEYIEGLNDE